MSSDNPKPEQIQANVAAALSRLRGDVMPPITSQAAPKLAGDPAEAPMPTAGAPKPASFFPQPPSAAQQPAVSYGAAAPHGSSPLPNPQAPASGLSAGNAPSADFRAEPSLGLGNGASTMPTTPAAASATGKNYFSAASKPAQPAAGAAQPDLLSSVDMGPPPLTGYTQEDNGDARRKRNRRLVLAGAAAAIVVVAGIWLASGHKSEVPTITAETTPEKVKPTNEGGLQVPNQNVQVLENMNGQNGQQQASGETVLPPPEQPIAPPTPAPDGQAQAGAQEQGATGQATTGQATTGQAATGQATTAQTDAQAPAVAAPAVPAVPNTPAVPSVPAVPDTSTTATASQPAAAQPAAAQPAAPQPAAEQVAAKPAAKPAVTEPAAGGKVKVQLAAVKTEAAAKTEWAKLQRAHPAQLGQLSLSVQKVDKGAEGVFYRIQAGPLADKAAAKALCAELAKQKQACILTR